MSLAERELTERKDDRILCIYHGHCDDGFAAAWAVRHALGDECVEFYEGNYGEAPPDVTGRKVLLVDFSYKRPILEAMATIADGVLILDHHKTAQADLADLPVPPNFKAWTGEHIQTSVVAVPSWTRLAAVFDMNRSGAGLTWDYLHVGEPRPLFIDYVEDRDLWTKALPGIDEFTMALRSYPMTFEAWDQLFSRRYGETEGEVRARDRSLVESLRVQGTTIMRYYRARLEELKPMAYLAHFPGRFGDEVSPLCAVVNAPFCFASDLANEIIDLFPAARFGVVYFEEAPEVFKYSLRSRPDKLDVSLVASRHGGGGHRNASGFTVKKHLVHDPL